MNRISPIYISHDFNLNYRHKISILSAILSTTRCEESRDFRINRILSRGGVYIIQLLFRNEEVSLQFQVLSILL